MKESMLPARGGGAPEEGVRHQVQLASFIVGEETYALDIMSIKEIVRPLKMTHIPKAPAFVEGVINLRGTVIPVVSLRRRFDLPPAPEGKKKRVIICAVAGKIVGLMVDEVTEVRSFTRGEIQHAPQFIKGRGAEFFLGVCRVGEALVMLLDLEKILSSEEKIALDKMEPVKQVEHS